MQRKTQTSATCRARRGGYAMILTLVLVAVATVVAWSLLAEGSLTVESAAARTQVGQADLQAESGVQAGLHFLEFPADAERAGYPLSDDGTGRYPASFELDLPDAATIAVTTESLGDGTYRVAAEARRQVGSTTVRREAAALARRTLGFAPTHAIHARDHVDLNAAWTIDGGIRGLDAVHHRVTQVNAAHDVKRKGYPDHPPEHAPVNAKNYNNEIDAPDAQTVPEPEKLRLLAWTSTYEHAGETHNVVRLERTTVTPGHIQPLRGRSDNPMEAFYLPGASGNNNVIMNGFGDFSGTLVVRKNLYIRGDLTVRARGDMPALMVGERIILYPGARLTVDGLVYAGRGIRGRNEQIWYPGMKQPVYANGEPITGEDLEDFWAEYDELSSGDVARLLNGQSVEVELDDDEHVRLVDPPYVEIRGVLMLDQEVDKFDKAFPGELRVTLDDRLYSNVGVPGGGDESGNQAGDVEVLSWE